AARAGEYVGLRAHADATEAQMLPQLAKIQNSMAHLAHTITTHTASIQNQLEARVADIDRRMCRTEKTVEDMAEDIKLPRKKHDLWYEQNLSSKQFPSRLDSAERPIPASWSFVLKRWPQQMKLFNISFFGFKSVMSTWTITRFKVTKLDAGSHWPSMVHVDARRAAQCLAHLKRDDGSYWKFETTSPDNVPMSLFISADKNLCQIKKELYTKLLRKFLSECYASTLT
ncbi:unnamed protein product, partial [Prorocentrum cordatum]